MTHTYGWEANEPVHHYNKDHHYVQRIAKSIWDKQTELVDAGLEAGAPDWERIADMGLMAALCEDLASDLYDLANRLPVSIEKIRSIKPELAEGDVIWISETEDRR